MGTKHCLKDGWDKTACGLPAKNGGQSEGFDCSNCIKAIDNSGLAKAWLKTSPTLKQFYAQRAGLSPEEFKKIKRMQVGKWKAGMAAAIERQLQSNPQLVRFLGKPFKKINRGDKNDLSGKYAKDWNLRAQHCCPHCGR